MNARVIDVFLTQFSKSRNNSVRQSIASNFRLVFLHFPPAVIEPKLPLIQQEFLLPGIDD